MSERQDMGASADADQALVAGDQAASRLAPPGFDPSREAAALTEAERRYLLATPRQEPADAGIIAYHAGDPGGGALFAGFARRQAWLFTRMRNIYDTAFTYRLSRDGVFVADAIAMEAREGRDGATRLDGEAATARAGTASPNTGADHD